jgi:hypothetical protein
MAIKEAARYLKIVQINTRRSPTAMTELREYCNRHKVDIAYIQELAIKYGKLANMTAASTSIFYSKDSMAAIIIYNRNLIVTKISQGTDTYMVTVEVQLNRKSFYIINQYCQFSEPIEDHMSKLSNMSLLMQQSNIVYCAEVNAKSSLWFFSVTDQKEKIVEETLWNLGLQVANEPGQPSTYRGYTNNESNIDITALKGTLKDRKMDWKVVPNEISSDHNIIELDLDMDTGPVTDKTEKTDIQPRKIRQGKATRRTNKNGTIKPFKKSERSHDRIYKLDKQGLR